jgi:2-oxoglutarate dehydrogenase E1 component
VIDDLSASPGKITKLVFCSGKLYYDILEKKESLGKEDIALIRLEQLYPLPERQIKDILARYTKARQIEWAQEEPSNMGALNYIMQNFPDARVSFVARPPSGSPATGSSQLHKIQQGLITYKALGICTCEQAYGSCRLHCSEQ